MGVLLAFTALETDDAVLLSVFVAIAGHFRGLKFDVSVPWAGACLSVCVLAFLGVALVTY